MRMPIAVAVLGCGLAFGQGSEPTKREIENAYRSGSAAFGGIIPGVRWENRRVKEVRGWKLKYKQLMEKRDMGVLTRHYQIIAKNRGQCADYLVVDIMAIPPNPQIKPVLNVEPQGVHGCR